MTTNKTFNALPVQVGLRAFADLVREYFKVRLFQRQLKRH